MFKKMAKFLASSQFRGKKTQGKVKVKPRRKCLCLLCESQRQVLAFGKRKLAAITAAMKKVLTVGTAPLLPQKCVYLPSRACSSPLAASGSLLFLCSCCEPHDAQPPAGSSYSLSMRHSGAPRQPATHYSLSLPLSVFPRLLQTFV